VTVFFTSDTHFGDHRTLNIHKRAFGSVAEMDGLLIERWNAAVRPDDEVWHLGDFARSGAAVDGLLERLNGRKHLVGGNNDPPATRAAVGWATVQDYSELDVEGRRLVLCHYPFRTWNGQHRGALNLHGHSHGRLKPLPRQYDVGVDVWDWQPVTLERIIGLDPLK
jgi:calcineurin-like phosphoesterase family protein